MGVRLGIGLPGPFYLSAPLRRRRSRRRASAELHQHVREMQERNKAEGYSSPWYQKVIVYVGAMILVCGPILVVLVMGGAFR